MTEKIVDWSIKHQNIHKQMCWPINFVEESKQVSSDFELFYVYAFFGHSIFNSTLHLGADQLRTMHFH